MKSISSKIIESHVPSTIDKTKINYGFHAIQSMNPLHMHIISNDFQSDCLKNKKHWNSFTTPYFIHLDPLISHLDSLKEEDYFKQDKFNLNNKSKLESYLKMDLKCHVCHMAQSNMPNLKKHLQTH
jgi:aprataxin